MPKLSLAIGGIGILIALIAGFLSFTVIGKQQYNLINYYSLVMEYASKGGESEAFNEGLGLLLKEAANKAGDVLIAVALLLIFWPATIIGGGLEILSKNVKVQAGIYGIIAFISSYFIVNAANSRNLIEGISLGIGAYILLIASIILIVAFILSKREKREKEK